MTLLSSRSSRPPRTAGGQFAAATRPKQQQQQQPSRPHRPHHHHSRDATTSASDADDALGDHGTDGPPAKRRRLSIRHKQTTLDTHFAPVQSAPPKPPTKVTVTQPHGQLLETLNGVRTALDVNEDELGSDGPPTTTPPSRVPPRHPEPKPAVKAPEKKEDKRTLRSQDEGPRLKSELATYFPNYEDVMFDVRKEPEFITTDSAIYITDDANKQQQPSSAHPSPAKQKGSPAHTRNGSVNGLPLPTTPQRTGSNAYNGHSPIDLDSIMRNIPDTVKDPLDDEHFLKSHRRAERKEKQLRNIEKERAMHEKVQLERLSEGLQGHDWLKVLGITGITDGEAKKYEPKRDYFIAEVKGLVDKFKLWKEQEKRQRIRKEAAATREAESEEPEESEGSVEPPSSELAAGASRQLQEETAKAVRSGFKIRFSKGKATGSGPSSVEQTPSATAPPPNAQLRAVPPPSPEIPITSFYKKRHLRDAALGKARHGRNVTAFGHPIPEMEYREFELPPEYLNEDVLRANARERRRRKRASIADAAGS
jgi:hypothetical protein